MAEGVDQKETGLENLEKEITCPVCQERYCDPKMLPCLHYYCRECVRQLALRGQPFSCPECRKETFLPHNDPDRLPTLFFVNRMKDVHAQLEKAQRKVEATCEMCGEEKAEAFCRQCAYFICDRCVQLHPKLRVFAGHEVVTLDELKEGGLNRIPPLLPVPPPRCTEHDELLKLFCFDCDRLICRDCLIDDHSGHKREFVKKAVPECRKMLREGLAPLGKINADITEATKQVEVVKTRISSQSASVTTTIQQSFKNIHELLYRREQELLSKTSKLAEKKLDTLNAQQKSLQMTAAEILSLSDFVKKNLESATDEELICLHKAIVAQLQEKRKQHSQLCLDPVETANINPHMHCAQMLFTVSMVDISKCKAEGIGARIADLGTHTQFTVHVACLHGEPYSERPAMTLKSLVDGSVMPCAITEKGRGVYEVSYIPNTRGRNSLTVTVSGKEITGSPFQVFVKIHPTKLDAPVRTITGVRRPWGIAINTQQQLLAAEDKAVAVLDVHGKRLRTIQCDQFGGPTGVACDANDNVYVTDHDGTLLKFDKDGKLLKTVGSKTGQFSHPGMIRIIGDKVYVCDRDNYKVQILDLDLQFVGSFGSKGSENGKFNFPQDIIADRNGNLFVTDYWNHRVQVFDSDGHFLRAFAEKGPSEKLNQPIGLCFDSNQFLFVTEFMGKSVSVFKPTGEFMTSLTLATIPAGVVIDEDGFVYVCDYSSGNNRILVF